jgi:hypothetical protein
MIRKLRAKEVATSETTGRRNVRILFNNNAVVDVLEFIKKTEVGKRPAGASDEADS